MGLTYGVNQEASEIVSQHVASHLQTLMLLTIRLTYLVREEEDEVTPEGMQSDNATTGGSNADRQGFSDSDSAWSATEALRIDQTGSVVVEERRKRLLELLRFDELDSRHTNIKDAFKKTCSWFLSDEFYVRWLDPDSYSGHHGFLWISGKPGSGKSTLMKFIYSNMSKAKREEPDTAIVAFFFNARGTELEKSTPGLYRSLIFQILSTFPDLQEVLDTYQDQGTEKIRWDLGRLQQLFQDIIGALKHRRLVCFIDALDECDEEQVQTMIELFEELGETAMINGTQFYLCLSSRHYPHVEIRPCLRRTLENQAGHTQDIRKYITAKFRPGSSTSKVSNEISTMLLEKAGGVFMWVVLVIDILNKELRDGRAATIKRHIAALPSGLMELFQRILLRDDTKQGDLLLCVQWILYAKRPLEVSEFYYAMHSGQYQGADVLQPHDPQSVTREYMDRFVLSSSKGLAEVTKTKKGIVQFIHESVLDFLLKENGLRYLASKKEENFEARSHDELKKCCQFYIGVDLSPYAQVYDEQGSLSTSERKAMRETVSTQFPFLAYATAYMFHHANAAQIFISQDNFLARLDLHQWLRCDHTFQPTKTRRHSFEVNLVYLFADQGWARLLAWALESIQLPAENRKDRYVHPLIAASTNGHREVVEVLIEKGADINVSDKLVNPLLAAISGGHPEIARLLLEKGADVDAEGGVHQEGSS